MIDWDRIQPLRVAEGSHEPGSGKGCAMNVISYITGEARITDFPACSSRKLARIVQAVNDKLAGADGFLSSENAIAVIELGMLTIGTMGASDEEYAEWLNIASIAIPHHFDPFGGPVFYWNLENARTAIMLYRDIMGLPDPEKADYAALRGALITP